MGDEKSIFQQSCLDDDFEMESDEGFDRLAYPQGEQMTPTEPEQNILDSITIKKNRSVLQNNQK